MPFKDPIERRARARAWQREKAKDPAWRAKRMQRERAHKATLPKSPRKLPRFVKGSRAERLWCSYKLTEAAYEKLLTDQGGVCAICKTSSWGGLFGVPNVDHCHATGKVRGLLCNRCNVGIGKFGDDPLLLGSAISYLKGCL